MAIKPENERISDSLLLTHATVQAARSDCCSPFPWISVISSLRKEAAYIQALEDGPVMPHCLL